MGKKKKIELKTTKVLTGIADAGSIQLTLKMPKKELKKFNKFYGLHEPMDMKTLASTLIQHIDVVFEDLSNDEPQKEPQEEETPVVEETPVEVEVEASEDTEVEPSDDMEGEAEEEVKAEA